MDAVDLLATLVNATLRMRDPLWWGSGTACASDSKKFGSWSSNLMTEYHARYGGHGVMIYWHVDRKSVCVYSQLRSCNASEVATMMEGVLRHCRTGPGHRRRPSPASDGRCSSSAAAA
ncbi:Tn3 family transposase [Streptosporangium sp. NPDC002544]|uniref:Tn3 family transposase n=1 Tax=Streptosporangium sp. NPDC002544 TaxID=3154538 RepID=UPI003331C555